MKLKRESSLRTTLSPFFKLYQVNTFYDSPSYDFAFALEINVQIILLT